MPKLTEAQLTFGTELDPHGRRIGRDPRRMTQDELSATGTIRCRCSRQCERTASTVAAARRRRSGCAG
jgi:hypothetical protein